MQRLDVFMYGPLKIFLEKEINRFQKAHLGRIVNQYDVAKLFSLAYLKYDTANNALIGFRSPGLWPITKDEAEKPSTSAFKKIAHQEATTHKNTKQTLCFDEINDDTTIEIETPSTPKPETLTRPETILRKVIAEALASRIQGSSRNPPTSRLKEFEVPIDAERSSTSGFKKFRRNSTTDGCEAIIPGLDRAPSFSKRQKISISCSFNV